MRSYSELKLFTAAQLDLARRARLIVEWLPDFTHLRLRCHEVARIVGHILDLPVIDGYSGVVQHSWLNLEDDEDGQVSLDVYAVARLPMVQLIDATTWAPAKLLREDADLWKGRGAPAPPNEKLISQMVAGWKSNRARARFGDAVADALGDRAHLLRLETDRPSACRGEAVIRRQCETCDRWMQLCVPEHLHTTECSRCLE